MTEKQTTEQWLAEHEGHEIEDEEKAASRAHVMRLKHCRTCDASHLVGVFPTEEEPP